MKYNQRIRLMTFFTRNLLTAAALFLAVSSFSFAMPSHARADLPRVVQTEAFVLLQKGFSDRDYRYEHPLAAGYGSGLHSKVGDWLSQACAPDKLPDADKLKSQIESALSRAGFSLPHAGAGQGARRKEGMLVRAYLSEVSCGGTSFQTRYAAPLRFYSDLSYGASVRVVVDLEVLDLRTGVILEQMSAESSFEIEGGEREIWVIYAIKKTMKSNSISAAIQEGLNKLAAELRTRL